MKKAVCSLVLILLLGFPLQVSSCNQPYFQQQANHLIRVSLDDINHFLHAYITTTYINNSPDTLDHIYIHLWPNAFSSHQTALAKELLEMGNTSFHFASADQRGFIDSLDFRINNKPVVWSLHSIHPDIAILYLEETLLPADTLIWETPFRVKFPDSRFSRLGHNNQAYHASQWYPKPAVYDCKGWHPMPYLSYSEFYSEFGNINVFLTLPRNYVVASSGEVMNYSERMWLEGLAKKTAAVASQGIPDQIEFPASEEEQKTIHLRQNQVHDFAWVADKRFHVSKSSVRLPGRTRRVDTWAFFYANSARWLKATDYLNDAIGFFSSELGNYPWQSKSAAMVGNSGGANMEYPSFTVIGPVSSDFALQRVLVHEVGHNWFYGMLASNEREHPWMDEGFTQYYEIKYLERKFPDQKLLGQFAKTLVAQYFNLADFSYNARYSLGYVQQARKHLDQPIGLPAPEFTPANYFSMVYFKTALALNYLEQYLGSDVFEIAMREYFDTWAFMHPSPEDLRQIFERVAQEDLSWFFEDLILSSGKINYKASQLSVPDAPSKDPWQIAVQNKGDLAVPFPISGMKRDSIVHTTWYEGFHGKKVLEFPAGDYDGLEIDAERIMPELFRHKNRIRAKGILPRARPLELQPLGSLEDPLKKQVFFAPVIGWNQYNGFLPAMAFYNTFFPTRPFRWFAMPMHGLANDRLAGIAWLQHSFYPAASIIHNWEGEVNVRRFAFGGGSSKREFNRLMIILDATLRKPFARSSVNRNLWLRNVWIVRDHYTFENQQIVPLQINYYVNEMGYAHSDTKVLNPWKASLKIQQAKGLVRLMGETVFFINYPRASKGVEFRLFAGTFLVRPSGNSVIDYRFRLSAVRGLQDFLFDHTFLGRSEAPGSFLGNQVWEKEGAFKFPTPIGQTWNWLATMNIKADLPLMPASIFLDAGTYQGAADAFYGSRTIPWVLGIQVVPFKGILEINFPLATSSDIEQTASFTMESYKQKVTFTLHLNRLDPFQWLRNLDL